MTETDKVQRLFEAWVQNQSLASVMPTWSLIREAFETGWKARGLEPDVADVDRVLDSVLHSLIRRNPTRAKVIIRKLSEKLRNSTQDVV